MRTSASQAAPAQAPRRQSVSSCSKVLLFKTAVDALAFDACLRVRGRAGSSGRAPARSFPRYQNAVKGSVDRRRTRRALRAPSRSRSPRPHRDRLAAAARALAGGTPRRGTMRCSGAGLLVDPRAVEGGGARLRAVRHRRRRRDGALLEMDAHGDDAKTAPRAPASRSPASARADRHPRRRSRRAARRSARSAGWPARQRTIHEAVEARAFLGPRRSGNRTPIQEVHRAQEPSRS